MNVCILKILYCDRTAIFEGVDVKKTSESKECNICHYWYLLNKGFKFQPSVCKSIWFGLYSGGGSKEL